MSRQLIAVMLVTLSLVLTSAFPALAQDTDRITPDEAETIALALYPDAAVVRVEQSFENRMVVWDVKLDNGIAVYVSVTTGAIVEVEPWQEDAWASPPDSEFIAPRETVPPVDIGTDGVDFAEARAIALGYYPDAAVVAIDLERVNRVQAWDVMLDNGMAVYINARTGRVIEFEVWHDSAQWREDTPPWVGSPGGRRTWQDSDAVTTPITRAEAIEIALTAYPGRTVLEVTQGRDDGRAVWDIELSGGITLDIDMQTGRIIDTWQAGDEREEDDYDDDDYYDEEEDWDDYDDDEDWED